MCLWCIGMDYIDHAEDNLDEHDGDTYTIVIIKC